MIIHQNSYRYQILIFEKVNYRIILKDESLQTSLSQKRNPRDIIMRSKDKWDKIYEINENLQYTQHFTFCRTIGCGGIPVKTY